jgi:gas vesicle protein
MRSPFFWLGLGVGVGAGIAIGMLYAPRSGERTRNILAHRAEEGKKFMRQRATKLQDAAEELLDKSKSAVQHVQKGKDDLVAAFNSGKRALGVG